MCPSPIELPLEDGLGRFRGWSSSSSSSSTSKSPDRRRFLVWSSSSHLEMNSSTTRFQSLVRFRELDPLSFSLVCSERYFSIVAVGMGAFQACGEIFETETAQCATAVSRAGVGVAK